MRVTNDCNIHRCHNTSNRIFHIGVQRNDRHTQWVHRHRTHIHMDSINCIVNIIYIHRMCRV